MKTARYLACVALLAMTVASAAIAEESAARKPVSPKVEYNQPIQPLGEALKQFGKTSGFTVMVESSLARGLTAPALRGSYTPAEALDLILASTGLRAEYLGSRTVAIRSDAGAKGTTSGLVPADQMRMAQAGDGEALEGSAEPPGAEDERQVTVRDTHSRPDFAANADIPRTINDVQPYYIFDAKTIEQSGAANIEDFLKQRLTMNTVAQTNREVTTNSTRGNTSSINLRGVGEDKTLILVNGRRMANVNIGVTGYQTDLNGIPVSAIERVEVLPSSASGIYGGSAIGGVVNIILKRDYSGGEMRVNYDNTVNGDSPRRTASLSYGLTLEEGKTNVSFNGAWSDQKSLLLEDRVQIYEQALATLERNSPGFVYSSSNPWRGSLPNIIPASSSVATLTLDAGNVPLNSRNTHIPAGTSNSTPAATLAAGLLANAGQWSRDFPRTTQGVTGLLRPFGASPENRSLQASVRRQMLPWLEVVADLAWNENSSESIWNPAASLLAVDADVVTNPFTVRVGVTIPDAGRIPISTRSLNRSAMVGALAQLPFNWTAALDYSWSENRFDYIYYGEDTAARAADLASGALNPFVDTLLYPLNLQKYVYPISYAGDSHLQDIVLRGSGPLPALPWGAPSLAVGLERRIALLPERTQRQNYPISVANSTLTRFYERESTTDSGYAEATVPLVQANRFAGLHGLELQLSGRIERYTVDTGSSFEQIFVNRTPPTISYGNPLLNGLPYFSEATYTSSNYTAGLSTSRCGT
jgi:iron complex outermembrane receptor protein